MLGFRVQRGRLTLIFGYRAGDDCGGVAQLGERLLCKQEVVGSIPSASRSKRGALPHTRRRAAPLDRTHSCLCGSGCAAPGGPRAARLLFSVLFVVDRVVGSADASASAGLLFF